MKIFLLLAATAAWAQQTQPVAVQPSCNINFNFTAAGSTTPVPGGTNGDNRSTACNSWLVSYSVSGFTGLTMTLQSAPNVCTTPSSCAPGSWGTYAGQTVVVGSNPATATTSASACIVGYNPWVRMNLSGTTGSGVVTGNAQGFANFNICGANGLGTTVTIVNPIGQKLMAASVSVAIASDQSAIPVTGSFSPSGTQDVNLKQVNGNTVVTGGVNGSQGVGGLAAQGSAVSGNPIPNASLDSAGNLRIPDYCTLKAVVTASTSGSTQLVAVSGSTTIRICHWAWTGETQVLVKLVTGTGASCTSPADETSTFTGAGSGIFGVVQDYTSAWPTTAAKTLCINLSGSSTNGSAEILYSQR